MSIKIRPADKSACAFEVEHTLMEGEARFARSAGPHGHEMADAILGLPGISEVIISGGTVTVLKSDDRDWRELEEPIAYAIQMGVAPDIDDISPGSGVDIDDDDMLFEQIEEFFEKEINPGVASHSGKVELIDIQDLTLIVRMMGGCQGCGMANVTLKQGIEGSVRKIWPVIKGVKDITDHASGDNPYFKSEKK